MTRFSVIMPTYNQAQYIRRAIISLLNQSYDQWELILINDGATDSTELYIQDFLKDKRIRYCKNESNTGLGAAINKALDLANNDYIAYLPSDDFYYTDHLESLKEEFEKSDDISLTFTHIKSEIKDSIAIEGKDSTNGLFNFYSLQLVQTAHKKTDQRWTARNEWVSENLYSLFWWKLIDEGLFSSINKITAHWTIHPHQHHRIVSEKFGGGLNYFRQFYNVKEPIKLRVSDQKFIDEEMLYKDYRNLLIKEIAQKPLKIVLLGELAYNSERIFALEESGHKLYGLWMKRPSFSFTTVGHIPFGNVEDIPYDNWEEVIKEIKPDIIYGLLNFGAVNLAYEVIKKKTGIPFVWHFKEGPFLCQQNGTWEKLIDIYTMADGKIYLSPELREWYELFIPERGNSFILDGDLPKANSFTDNFSKKMSETDGHIHTVIPGRVIGMTANDMKILADNNIHVHLYTENYYESRDSLNKELMSVAPNHFHLHPHCSFDKWVEEFSKYDAGWLHCFDSQNNGDLMQATWNDLNIPARMNTLAAAGLPMIQKDNSGHIVAMQSRLESENMGVFFKTYEELAQKLKDQILLKNIENNVRRNRLSFSFDYHVPQLIAFFNKVIETKKY